MKIVLKIKIGEHLHSRAVDRLACHYFVSSRPITKISADLMNVKQQPDETFYSYHAYLALFNEESLQIPDSIDQVMMVAFIYRFHSNPINIEMHRDYSATLD